jgi:molybdenum cofactor cytidylyltransferase
LSGPKNIGAVILAAGSSSRLGRPKQLVEYNGKTLLQHTIDCVTDIGFNPSILVLGANRDKILNQTETQNITVSGNSKWAEGIASSILYGLEESLRLNPSLQHILYLLSDQPYVNQDLLKRLINSHLNGSHDITACTYKNNIGVPALFEMKFFPDLMTLKGDIGAKKIMIQHRDRVHTISFEDGALDVDTEEDVSKLQETNTQIG